MVELGIQLRQLTSEAVFYQLILLHPLRDSEMLPGGWKWGISVLPVDSFWFLRKVTKKEKKEISLNWIHLPLWKCRSLHVSPFSECASDWQRPWQTQQMFWERTNGFVASALTFHRHSRLAGVMFRPGRGLAGSPGGASFLPGLWQQAWWPSDPPGGLQTAHLLREKAAFTVAQDCFAQDLL